MADIIYVSKRDGNTRGVYKQLIAGDGISIDESDVDITLSSTAGGGGAFTSKCSAYQSVVQSIPKNETTKIELKAEDYDTDGEFDSTTNYRFQPATNGYYHVSGSVCLSSLGYQKVMYPQIRKNGSQWCFTGFKNGAAATVGASISCDMYLLTTDFVELFVYHDDTVSRNTVVTNRNTFMTVHRFA